MPLITSLSNINTQVNTLIHVCAILFIWIFWNYSLSAQTVITGKLLGADGNPMKHAMVNILYPGDTGYLATVEADKDGSYSISTVKSGPLLIRFVGVNHSAKNVVLLNTSEKVNENIDVRLSYNTFSRNLSKLSISGDFNDYKLDEMNRQSDGSFSYTISTDKPIVRYKLVWFFLPDGNYVYDSKYGYLVKGEPKDGKLEVRIDPSSTNILTGKFIVKFGNENSEVAKYALAFMTAEKMIADYQNANNEYKKTHSNPASFIYDTEPQIKSVSEKINKETDPVLKQILHYQKLILAQNCSPDNTNLVNSAIDEFITNVPANSFVAAYLYFMLPDIFFDFTNDLLPSRLIYVDELLKSENVASGTKSKIIRNILSAAVYAGNEVIRNKYYSLLMEKFSESYGAKQAKEFLFDKEIIISKGNLAPQFSLRSLDDPNVTFTIESFKGKILLIDFWATWCGPCKVELPVLSKLYERFHSKGFEVLSMSFDNSPDVIMKFRKEVLSMPWLHVHLEGGFNNQLAKNYEVSAIPKPILIDGTTGKILAVSYELRGENLEKTLEKFFK